MRKPLVIAACVLVAVVVLAAVVSLVVFRSVVDGLSSDRQASSVTRSDLNQLKRGMKEKQVRQAIGSYDRTIWMSGKRNQRLRCLAYTYEISQEKGIAGKLGLDDSAYLVCFDARTGRLVEMKDRTGTSGETPIPFSTASPKTVKPAKAS